MRSTHLMLCQSHIWLWACWDGRLWGLRWVGVSWVGMMGGGRPWAKSEMVCGRTIFVGRRSYFCIWAIWSAGLLIICKYELLVWKIWLYFVSLKIQWFLKSVFTYKLIKSSIKSLSCWLHNGFGYQSNNS